MTESIITGIIITALILLGVYAAYFFGYLTLTSHASVLYVGNIKRAKFSKCNGTFKKIIRLDQCKTYTFQLNSELTDGEICVNVMDKNKKTLLILDRQTSIGNIYSQEKSRYYLVVQIKKASGSYNLEWK